MSLYSSLDIRFADPISALSFNENFLISGSMLGRISVYNLKTKKENIVAELSSENITGVDFESSTKCSLSVGDEAIIRYTLDEEDRKIDFYTTKNYSNEGTHKQKCETMYTMLTNGKLLLFELDQVAESGVINIVSSLKTLRIKDVIEDVVNEYEVEMSNYSVPFEFTGTRFLWVEFLNEKDRNICCYDLEKNEKFQYPLTKQFGHISFAKLYRDNIILVKDLNICEIRKMDSNFTLIKSFESNGDEVIAFNTYTYKKTININDDFNKKEKEMIEIKDEKDKNLHFNEDNNDKNLGNNEINYKHKGDIINHEHNENDSVLVIIMIDIDGNVNTIENMEFMNTKFNMYQIKDISQETKDKMFFSMGYPYLVKADKKYIVVSTDFGVFIFNNSS